MNIFFLNVYLNRELNNKYHFDKIVQYMEVPLDKRVGKKLVTYARKNNLTKRGKATNSWKDYKNLTKNDSDEFQKIADKYAKEEKLFKAELDLILWP